MAKARSIGSIYAELALRDGKFKAGLKSSRAALNKFGSSAMKWGGAGLAAGISAAGVAFGITARKTLGMQDALGDASAQVGVAVSDMMVLQRTYEDGGRAASMAGADIAKMQKSLMIAAHGGKDPFAALGLSVESLLAMNPAQQFQTIGAAISAIQNPAERTALAMEIFGRGGKGLMTVFGGIESAEKALGRMPHLAEQFASAADEANDLIGHLPIKSDQFFVGFNSGILGTVLPALRKIDDYDFTDMGESLGVALGTAIESVTDGKAWELFQLHAEKAMLSIQSSPAMNSFAAGINTVWDKILADLRGEDFNMADAFDKYASAGIEANTEIIDDLDARIRAINQSVTGKYEKARRDSVMESNLKAANEQFFATQDQPVTETDFFKKASEKSPADSGIDFVDEYMRRGLSLSPTMESGSTQGMKSIASNVTEILRAIKNPPPPKAAIW